MQQILLKLFISFYFIVLIFSKVTDLSSSNFDSEIEAHQTSKYIITFYSPQCPHCLKYLPQFTEISEKLKGSAYFGTVNCNQNEPLADRFEIKYVPTILLIKEGFVYTIKPQDANESKMQEIIMNPLIAGEPKIMPTQIAHFGMFRHFFLKYQKKLIMKNKRRLK